MNFRVVLMAVMSLIAVSFGTMPAVSGPICIQAEAGNLSAGDLPGTFDLKAVPRPPDGIIIDWDAGSTSTSIVYRYPSSVHSRDDLVRFYVNSLPDLGWVWEARSG